MKLLQIRKILYFLLATLMIPYACSKHEDLNPLVNPNADSINSVISQLPDWKTETLTPAPAVLVNDVMVPTGGAPYKCEVFKKNLARTFESITSVETNFGVIWPGALIQGKTLKSGELKNINLKRSPITIQINIPLPEGSKKVDVPNSVNVQQAISDFQIAAGQMPEGSQSGAGLMNFSVEEAASFEQSMLAMGISGGFTDPESQVGLDASANVSVERAYNENTVIAKFVQEMFTVRIADDQMHAPVDFLAPDVTTADLKGLENKGELGAGNIPLYIESVTYGRILLFTMKSTSVSSGSQLSTALQASMGDYVNGGGSLSNEQKQILENSTTTIFSAGGTKDAANAAIANLNWSEFFKAAPATTAVPISFKVKTLNGEKTVQIADSVNYMQRDNCNGPSSYDVTVTWPNNDYSGLCIGGACPNQAWVKLLSNTFGTELTLLNGYKYKMHFTPDDVATQTGRQFTISSSVELLLPGGLLTTKTKTTTHDVTTLNNGNTTVQHILQNYAGSVTLYFTINKVTNYDK